MALWDLAHGVGRKLAPWKERVVHSVERDVSVDASVSRADTASSEAIAAIRAAYESANARLVAVASARERVN